MSRVIDWKNIVEESNGTKERKKDIRLFLDCVYKNKTYAQNYSNDVITVMFPGMGNQGGFRPCGARNGAIPKYVVIYSTGKDIYWPDELDEELGLYTYYGDNKVPGSDLHDKKGNQILRDVFEMSSSSDVNVRKNIPPFFLFERDSIGGVKFRGLLVPGYNSVPSREWLTALWAKRDEGGRFQNYKSIFTVLDTSSGSDDKTGEASIDMRWIDDLKDGLGFDSPYAPLAWKNWIKSNKYLPLKSNIRPRIRTKEEQLPEDSERKKMLNMIIDYFKDDPTRFEYLAISVVTLADNNILEDPIRTRSVKDGGRDGIGKYKLMNNLQTPLDVTFAVEAKCYNPNSNSVGVKELSRLLSRIRYRQFGVMVTTSYVGPDAYKELIADEQPIAIISGGDLLELLYRFEQVNNCDSLDLYLKINYPKDRKDGEII